MFWRNNVMLPIDPLPTRVRDALASGQLGAADLTARQLGGFLGKTSSVLYHHYGSLDGFLYRVTQSGMDLLNGRVLEALECGEGLADLAEAYVAFGLDVPALYQLMFERRYDWDALRKEGAFETEIPGLVMWASLTSYLKGLGSSDADMDARVLYAGLHGLVSLALSGRANVGASSISDREVAIAAARRLACKMEQKHD
jgi:AcrR family transcriptional regulator